MKSKYKLKIKEISMRLKNGSVLLLGILCLFAVAPIASATDWTDPTCAAPGCNTDGPIWVNPSSQQDSNAASLVPMINISDSRTSGVPAATAYVESALTGKPAIYGYSTGSSATSYGGYFSAAADTAPGLRVDNGVFYYPIGDGNILTNDDPSYNPTGLLYYSNDYGTYRYYDGSDWTNLPLWSKSGDEIYYTFAAGTARGVAIKSGDLTGPNDAYTLDVYRKTYSNVAPGYYDERAVYGRLASYSSDANYASGTLGAYDTSGNMIGVKGSATETGAVENYGGYFSAAGDTGRGVYGTTTGTDGIGGYFYSSGNSSFGVFASSAGTGGGNTFGGYFGATGATSAYGVYGIASNNGAAVQNYGGAFSAAGGLGRAVQGEATATGAVTNYGGHFTSGGNSGRGVYGVASATGAVTNYGVQGTAAGNSGSGVYGTATATGAVANYGGYFTSAGNSGRGVYGYASATGVGVANIGGMFRAEGDSADGVYSIAASTNNVTNYGGRFISQGGSGRGVYGLANSTTGLVNYGGYFKADGPEGRGIYAEASNNGAYTNYGGWFTAMGSMGIGVYAQGDYVGVYGRSYVTNGVGVMAYGPNTTDGAALLVYHGSMKMEELSTIPTYTGGYGHIYVKASDSKLYFLDDTNHEYDLTGGGSGTIEDGTANGQTPFWNNTAGEWQHTETSEMVWDDTNKNVGIGVASPTSTNRLHVVNSGTAAGSTAVYGSATGTSGTTYGGYFSNASSTGYGVYGVASNTSNPNYGGYFESAGWGGTGVTGRATGTGVVYGGNFAITNAAASSNSMAVYGNANIGGSNAVYGGYFSTTSTGGRGIYATSPYRAGDFYTAGSTGSAVYGRSAGTGTTYGGYFYNADTNNTGSAVYGYNANSGSTTAYAGHFVIASGTGIAVRAENTSATGYAGYFDGRVYTSSKFLAPTIDSATSPSFTWYADDNTGLFRVSGGDIIGFTTGGTEKMRLDASGNLSLGTTSTYGKLTVEGEIAFDEITAPSSSTGYGKLYVKSSDSKIYFKTGGGTEYDLTGGAGSATGDNGTAAGQMNFWDGSKWTYTETSEMVWNDTNKNVGIGVASPTSTNRLHVVNSGTAAGSAAVYGNASATGALENYGGYFTAAGDTSSAVYGAATSTGTAINYGGYFTTASGSVTEPNAAKAVYGYATKTGSFVTYGGYFKSDATFGIGAYGTGRTAVKGVSSESDDSLSGYGGYFTTESGAGSAVWAQANSSGVTNTHYGGYFRAPNGNGVGIYGSGAMESARFETSEVVISDGSDAIGYATGAGDLYVGDALEVDGTSYLANVNSSAQFLAYSSDTVSAPGYSWGGDTNTGIYHSAADTINFSTAGTLRVTIGSTGQVTLAGDLQVGGVADAVDEFIYFDGTAESLSWNNTTGRFDLSDELEAANIYTTGSYYVDSDITSSNDYLFFSGDATNQSTNNAGSIRFYNGVAEGDNRFYFSAPIIDVDTYSTLISTSPRDLYIDSNGLMGYISSSLRYKDNVQDMEDISWLYELRPVNYTYKTDDQKIKQYGLIAEEVEKVNPLFVSYNDEGVPETVSYSFLVTPMLSALQNQKQQLDALETKVEMIEKDGCSNNEAILMETIEKLEARIEALEAEKAEPVKTSFWSKLW